MPKKAMSPANKYANQEDNVDGYTGAAASTAWRGNMGAYAVVAVLFVAVMYSNAVGEKLG